MMALPLSDAALRQHIIAEARTWCGTPYRHQAALKQVGCDCLGLVRGIWCALYGAEPQTVPPYSPDWAEAGRTEHLAMAARRHLCEIEKSAIRPGDVLLFRWRNHVPAKHLAILTGPGSMIHAQHGAVVCETTYSRWWQRHLAYAFCFKGALPVRAAAKTQPPSHGT